MKYALTNVTVLNGHADMQPEQGKAVLIKGRLITGVVDASAVPDGYKKVDMSGKYLMPGLINLHVHIPSSGRPTKKKLDYEKLAKLLKFGVARAVVRKVCENNARQQLMSGTTTIRAVGGVMDFDTRLRDKINVGNAVGPRILAADCAVSVPGGHMTGSVAMPAHSAKEAVNMVRDLHSQHPDLIKLMITGGVLDAEAPGEPGVLKMPREYVAAAVEEAHRLGYPVAAHVEGNEGMVIALECGVDTIEHGGKPSEETTRLFKEKNAALVATLSPAVPFTEMDQAVTGMSDMDVLNGKALLRNMVDCINVCLQNGVTVGLGTDTGCPFVTQYDMWRELWYFCHYCGVTPQYALHTATEVNARILGITHRTGTVEPDKSADLLLTDGNPLEDLQYLRKPAAVVFRGKLYRDPKPKKIPAVEAALDALMNG